MSRAADQTLRVMRGFIWKCTETKTTRWIQIERYKRLLWKLLACHFVLWHSLSLSYRLGGAGDILLIFRKCQLTCLRECGRMRICAWLRGVELCVCPLRYCMDQFTNLIIMRKNTAENRLLMCDSSMVTHTFSMRLRRTATKGNTKCGSWDVPRIK